MRMIWVGLAPAILAACAPQADTVSEASANEEGVVLRNLADTDIGRRTPDGLRVEGTLMPTPSDLQSRYYLLRSRQTLTGTIIAIIRQEHANRVAYARTEADCGKGLFHVVGVADTRGRVETDVAHDGPLRPVKGLPLREEMATFICERSGEKLVTT